MHKYLQNQVIFISEMRIRLTESQVKELKLINEGVEVLKDFEKSISDLNDDMNMLYNKLTFSSLAEILDGAPDLKLILQEMHRLDNVYLTKNEKMTDFFNNGVSKEEYWAKWDKIHQKLENLGTKFVRKHNIIHQMAHNLQEIIENDPKKGFGDIEKREI